MEGLETNMCGPNPPQISYVFFLFSEAVCDIPGQVYQVCGSSCQRTCREISMGLPCKQDCAEGCNCPVGKALRDGNQCVPYSQCPCYRDGNAYDPGTVIKPTNCNKWWAASFLKLMVTRKQKLQVIHMARTRIRTQLIQWFKFGNLKYWFKDCLQVSRVYWIFFNRPEPWWLSTAQDWDNKF